ncbi:MAG TPA: YifB family Mg chelatase-like AAA ATPase [Patescibacteria group bacterium]|nr:YifB family Mg chelatase-like AAA ATPase [Patescibacteria group bacterium]
MLFYLSSIDMLSRLQVCAFNGLDVLPIDVEIDISSGQPNFVIVGLVDTAIQEAKERLRAALKNTGLRFPWDKRVVVNFAPADLKKEGTHYDLAMVIGVLQATSVVPARENALYIGEVALDGRLRSVNGVLPIAWFAKKNGFSEIFVPQENVRQAAVVEGIAVYGVASLQSLVLHLQGIAPLSVCPYHPMAEQEHTDDGDDFRYVKGQFHAKRALVIAASGGHNVLMTGAPGAGKTLLARSMGSIMPPLTVEECLEVSSIYSISGLLGPGEAYKSQRPFRSPHHSASAVALIGGGRVPMPGEITLAHRGVLFLDEFPEFPRSVIEALRQPLEDGVVSIARSQGHCTFPARVMLIAAQNPCPCGYLFDQQKQCACTPGSIEKYRRKISGPILDRIDLHVTVSRVPVADLESRESGESSETLRKNVIDARKIQCARYQSAGYSFFTNAELPSSFIEQWCPLDVEGKKMLLNAVDSLHLSARSYYRLIKVSRTIADLSASEMILSPHVGEALQYRFTEGAS